MSIIVKINTVDKSDNIIWDSLSVTQNLTSQVDTASFAYRKYNDRTLDIEYGDVIEIFDDATQIFGGTVQRVSQRTESNADGLIYNIECADYTVLFDSKLVAQTYTNQTIFEIIESICNLYATDFNPDNVMSTYLIPKIVFNQVKPSDCLKKLADIVNYDWYIDEDKSIHFFSKEENPAPFNLTDTSENYIYKSLERKIDGSKTVNRVKVRGGEYNGSTYTDSITVSGDDTKSFNLPYKFANLTVTLNTVSQTVGLDNIDSFADFDVLFNYQEKTIQWENPLTDGDIIEFSGNPKVRVFAIAEDTASIDSYGVIEKLIRDDDIVDNVIARKRALGELYAYANGVIDTTFSTYTPGLRAGQSINLTSTRRNCNDDLIIKSVTFQPIDTNTFGYRVQCISGKIYGLIEILAKLLAPKALPIDETEISEEIFADNRIVKIVEEHEVISAVEDTDAIAISEQHNIDLLGAGIEPIYVLGEYAPVESNCRTRFDFNEGSGTTINDIGEDGVVGTLTSGITFESSDNGFCAVFDGAYTTQIALTALPLANPFRNQPTIVATVFGRLYWDGVGDDVQYIIYFCGLAQYQISIYKPTKSIRYLGRNAADSGYVSWYSGNDTVPIGSWFTFEVQFNGTHLEFFINGISTYSTNSFEHYPIASTGFGIGYTARPLSGKIDDIRVLDKVLTTEERAYLQLYPADTLELFDTKRQGRLNYSMKVY